MARKRTKLPEGPFVVVELDCDQSDYLDNVARETGFTREVLAGKLLVEGMKVGLKVTVDPMGE